MKRRSVNGVALLCLCLAADAAAQGVHESFETPETTWKVVETDCRPVRLVKHERQFEGAYQGRGCEYLQLMAGQGTYLYLAHPVPAVRIIRELTPSVWVKSDRHGIQLMARIVLPRSLEDGKPITSFVYGDRYESPGSWRQLRIDDILTKLQREVVALRTQKGSQLDEREAYLDLLVLNAYTGPGTIQVATDDLELSGFAAATPSTAPPPQPVLPSLELGGAGSVARDEAPPANGVVLQGNILVAGGRPLFVRAVEHRGETFAYLQSLGFNTIQLATPPTPSQLQEAERSLIWLAVPPPRLPRGSEIATVAPPTSAPGGSGDGSVLVASQPRILAWHLGDRLTEEDWPDAMKRMQAGSDRGPTARLPWVAQVTQGVSQWRHESLILLLDRPLLHTSFDLQDYVAWLQHMARQSRASSPFWAAIPTEVSRPLQEQVARMAGTADVPLTIEPDQVRLASFAAVAAGARGLWFRSQNRLDGQDPVTRLRAATLRQLNRELDLVAPWAAGGTPLGEQITNNARVRVFGLRTDRARLLILLRRVSDQQYTAAPLDAQEVAFTLHGVPPTDQTYSVSAAGVDHLPSQRGGGVRLSLDQPELVSLILLTSDPLAVNYAGRTAATIRADTAAARRDAVTLLLEQTEMVDQAFPPRAAGPGRVSLLQEARAQLRRAEDLQTSNDWRNVLKACDDAANALRRERRGRWEETVLSFTSPAASPVCSTYTTLPIHHALAQQLGQATWGVDLLAGGEMEHLEHLLQSGWRQQRPELPGVSVDVQLSLEAPRVGRSALHLRAWGTEPAFPVLDGRPPVTILSAPVPVQAGQWLRIRGWAKAPRPLEHSWDGLMISDSHSGPELAERIAETQGWREFTLYRVATEDGPWHLRFSLTGLGEAWIDDVSVTALAAPPARQAAR